MKLWALILAAGAILAVAAPVAEAASTARPADTIRVDGLHTTIAFRDPLHGSDAFVRPLGQVASPATIRLAASGKLDDLTAPLLAPRPHFWPFLLLPLLG